MRVQGELADNRAALEYFFVELLVFFRIANIDARAEDSDGAALSVHGPLLSDGVDTTGQAADDYQPSRSQVAAEPLRHLRAVERRAARAHDADAG